MKELSDTKLLQRAHSGDDQALRVLMKKYEKLIYHLCYRILSNHEDAQDQTQEVFLEALRSATGFRGEHRASFRAWLCRIACNKCHTLQRYRHRMQEMSLGASHETEVPPPDELMVLQQAIEQLPRDYRTIIILRYAGDLSYKEIAQVLDLSDSTVGTRLYRAHKLLRKTLTKEGDMK